MVTTRQQLLGWLEHCEREHPGQGSRIPTWLCSMDAVRDAEAEGKVEVIGHAPLRGESTIVIYGLTHAGRQEFYSNLPKAGET